MGVEMKDLKWFQSTIDQYSNSSDHKKVLENVITEINILSIEERNNILSQLDFEPMFSILIKWNNPVFAEPFLQLVNVVFDYLKVDRIVSNNEELLLKFYNHVNKEFRRVLFSLLNKAIRDGEVECFRSVPNLMFEVVHSIADDPDSPALQLLENLITAPRGARIVFGSEIGQWLSDICDNPEVKYEIIELALKAVTESEETFLLVKDSKILADLASGLQGAMAHVDQSGFAATVECYTTLGCTPWGYQELLDSGILSRLEVRVVEYGPGTMEDKVMPAVYTLFGKLFQAFPKKIKVDCPNVVPTVVKLIEVSIDRAYVTRTEIEMIGMVSLKPEGKRYLASLGGSFLAVLQHLKTSIFSNSSGDKICALTALGSFASLEEAEKTDEMLNLIKSWFMAIFSSVKQLIEFCQEPFPGVKRTAIPIFVSETVQCRNAGLQLLANLMELKWGRDEICQQTKLLKWLSEGEESQDVHFCSSGAPNNEVLQLKLNIVGVLLKDTSLPPNAQLILKKASRLHNLSAEVKRKKCS